MRKLAVQLIIAGIIAVILIISTIAALTLMAEPPEVKVGAAFYDVSESLGPPDNIYIDAESCEVHLRYSFGALPFEQLMSIEINTSGTITDVKQDTAF